MLEPILQVPFSNFLNEIEPGTWILLGDISVTDRKWFSIWFNYGYSKPLEKASYYTKSKGSKEESIGRVFKKLILEKLS